MGQNGNQTDWLLFCCSQNRTVIPGVAGLPAVSVLVCIVLRVHSTLHGCGFLAVLFSFINSEHEHQAETTFQKLTCERFFDFPFENTVFL